jgi:tetratricopeptide (TPR) repeat protein
MMGAIEDAIRGLKLALARSAVGVHATSAPAPALDADLPAGLAAVYREFDGAELFHCDLVLAPRIEWDGRGGRVRVAELGEDSIWVALDTGVVWRLEEDTGEWMEEGSSFERWLWGWVEGQSVLYDAEGEFVAGVLDDEGELLPEAALGREGRLLKRDRLAAAPRWRLARALLKAGDRERARAELEEVVAAHPRFPWAWYDLARVSEALGDVAGAKEEALAAADADPSYEHAPFFLAWAARLAARAGDQAACAELAARARAARPDLARTQLEGARANLEAGDRRGARELVEVALALEPRDLAALDLLRRIEAA